MVRYELCFGRPYSQPVVKWDYNKLPECLQVGAGREALLWDLHAALQGSGEVLDRMAGMQSPDDHWDELLDIFSAVAARHFQANRRQE